MRSGCSGLPPWKRTLDILLSSLGLILMSPVFIAVIAIIRIASPGPAFFKQERIGRHGKPFRLWKFRTMRAGADSSTHQDHFSRLIASGTPMVKLDASSDPRIFGFGKFLRRSCLDELPQLINVLLGEMSMVGPRPCMPYEVQHYQKWQRRRFDAMPGITGLWQVSGKNRTTFTQMVQFDISYLENMSLLQDLKIICKTIPAIAFDDLSAGNVRRKANAQ